MGLHHILEAHRELPFQDTPGSRAKAYLAHGPHCFRQALSVHKALGESLTHAGLASVAPGALGAKLSQGEETSWATLKTSKSKSSVTVRPPKVHHLATPQGAALRVRAVSLPMMHGSSQVSGLDPNPH